MKENQFPGNENSDGDSSFLYDYIKTLELENLRRNEERISLEAQISQLKLDFELIRETNNNHEEVVQLKGVADRLWSEKQRLQQILGERDRVLRNCQIELDALKVENQRLRSLNLQSQQIQQKYRTLVNKSMGNTKSEAIQVSKPTSTWKLKSQEVERIREQVQVRLSQRFQRQKKEAITRKTVQLKSQIENLNTTYGQKVCKLQESISQLEKQVMTYSKKNQLASLEVEKVEKLNLTLRQLETKLDTQVKQGKRLELKFRQEKELTNSLNKKIKLLEIQTSRLKAQHKELQIFIAREVQLEKVTLQERIKKQHQQEIEAKTAKIEQIDQELRRTVDMNKTLQDQLRTIKNQNAKEGGDANIKLQIEVKLQKARIEKLERDLSSKNKQLQYARLEATSVLSKMEEKRVRINPRFASNEVSLQKQLEEMADKLKKIEFEAAFFRQQNEDNLKYIEILEVSHKKFRNQILSGINQINHQKQLYDQIAKLRKENSNLKAEKRSNTPSVATGKSVGKLSILNRFMSPMRLIGDDRSIAGSELSPELSNHTEKYFYIQPRMRIRLDTNRTMYQKGTVTCNRNMKEADTQSEKEFSQYGRSDSGIYHNDSVHTFRPNQEIQLDSIVFDKNFTEAKQPSNPDIYAQGMSKILKTNQKYGNGKVNAAKKLEDRLRVMRKKRQQMSGEHGGQENKQQNYLSPFKNRTYAK